MPVSKTFIKCKLMDTSKLDKYLGRIGVSLGGVDCSGRSYHDMYHICDSTVVANYTIPDLSIEVVGKDGKKVADRIVKWMKRHEKPGHLDVVSQLYCIFKDNNYLRKAPDPIPIRTHFTKKELSKEVHMPHPESIHELTRRHNEQGF